MDAATKGRKGRNEMIQKAESAAYRKGMRLTFKRGHDLRGESPLLFILSTSTSPSSLTSRISRLESSEVSLMALRAAKPSRVLCCRESWEVVQGE